MLLIGAAEGGLLQILSGNRLWFPDPRSAAQSGTLNGLVAVGGDLSVERLRLAYRSGIFPWTVDPITWWSPDPRAIFELDQFHVPRSLARVLRRCDGQLNRNGEDALTAAAPGKVLQESTPPVKRFQIARDRAFGQVIEQCAVQRPDGNWIGPEFIEAYTRLHQAGYAHSVECWEGEQLAGGIYGVALGGFFAGESMFYRVSNASKIALYFLIEHLRRRHFALFDIQVLTPTTRQLGGRTISREEYLKRLAAAVTLPVSF